MLGHDLYWWDDFGKVIDVFISCKYLYICGNPLVPYKNYTLFLSQKKYLGVHYYNFSNFTILFLLVFYFPIYFNIIIFLVLYLTRSSIYNLIRYNIY